MRVLVTGGAGYVGSVLTARLLEERFYTRVLDCLLFGEVPLLRRRGEAGFAFVEGDIRETKDLHKGFEGGIDAVVHLAAIVGDPACSCQPEMAQQVNDDATRNLVDLCREKGIKRFVFVSTCSNYGLKDSSRPATEDSPLNPLSLYAETKVSAEKYLLGAADSGLHPCILRLATVFGVSPRMRFDLLVNEFTRDAVIKAKLEVYGEQFWRPYVHVRDVAKSIAMVLKAPEELISGRVFNVGSNSENYQKWQVVRLILRHLPETRVEMVEQNADPRTYLVSFDKIARELDFTPSWRVSDGIVQIKNALESGVFGDPYAAKYQNARPAVSSGRT